MYIGPDLSPRPTTIVQSFNNSTLLNSTNFVFSPNSAVETVCGQPALHFTGSSGMQYLETNYVSLAGTTNFIQFSFTAGCSGSAISDFTIALQYSDDGGYNWADVLLPQCNGCSQWFWVGGSRFRSLDYAKGWTRVTIPLGSQPANRRYQWTRVSTPTADWALADIYMGSECPTGCAGRGLCNPGGVCTCDAGFVSSGNTCVADGTQPQELRETFESNILPSKWPVMIGGSQATTCGTVVSGNSMVFNQAGTRVAVTTDLNTVNARYIEMAVVLGTSSGNCIFTTTSGRNVIVGYSSSTYNWTLINSATIDYYNGFRGSPSRITFAIPAAARGPSVRFIIFQTAGSAANADVYVSIVLFVFFV